MIKKNLFVVYQTDKRKTKVAIFAIEKDAENYCVQNNWRKGEYYMGYTSLESYEEGKSSEYFMENF